MTSQGSDIYVIQLLPYSVGVRAKHALCKSSKIFSPISSILPFPLHPSCFFKTLLYNTSQQQTKSVDMQRKILNASIERVICCWTLKFRCFRISRHLEMQLNEASEISLFISIICRPTSTSKHFMWREFMKEGREISRCKSKFIFKLMTSSLKWAVAMLLFKILEVTYEYSYCRGSHVYLSIHILHSPYRSHRLERLLRSTVGPRSENPLFPASCYLNSHT